MKRKLLARSSNIATRQRVYRMDDGLEVDEVDHYEVRRSRVFYEDVVLMTYHRSRGLWFNVIVGFLALLFAGVALLTGMDEPVAGWWILGLSTAPLLLLLLLRLILGVGEINVYGRRTSARLRFWFRQAHARKLYTELAGAVRRRHSAMERASALRAVAIASPGDEAAPSTDSAES